MSTITEPKSGKGEVILAPVHPGEILREEYLVPLGLSAGALARRLGVPRTRIERLAGEATSMTVDTALRLARFFNTSAEFWMNLQTHHDLTLQARAKREELSAIRALDAA